MSATTGGHRDRISEADVVFWLKTALVQGQFLGEAAREILVDADGSYLRSPYRKKLEPTGAIRIGSWRADLLCILQSDDAERLVGFEVKADTDLEKGVVQASRYRIGVHEAYLCIPSAPSGAPQWLTEAARQNGVGLACASRQGVEIPVAPPQIRPDPKTLLATRRYLLGEGNVRALGLNKPLHYVAVLMAFVGVEDPTSELINIWGLRESAVRHAYRGAETLGLISDGYATPKGRAYADIFRTLGFSLSQDRHLTRQRLANSNPGYAAVLRAILLDNATVIFIIRALAACGGGPVPADRLAARATIIEEGMARAVFGPRPEHNDIWHIRPTTRFNLKAALYDVGLLASPLGRGAGAVDKPGGYHPSADIWQISAQAQPV
jgi:hypothetical protein